MIVRNCNASDVERIRKFIDECKPLELHTSFTYWMLFYYFPNLCFLMLENEKILGFISGIRSSADEKVVYLWQIGVSKDYQGKKYSSILIDNFLKAALDLKCNKIQVSIDPKNLSSYQTFLKYSNNCGYKFSKIGKVSYHDKLSNEKDHELLYQIDL